MSKQDAENLHEMLSRIWDQGPSADLFEQLEDFARVHGEPAHEEILRYTSMHSELTSQMSSSHAFEASVAAILEDRASHQSTASLLRETSWDANPSGSRVAKARAKHSAGWLALAMGLLIAAGFGLWWNLSQPEFSKQNFGNDQHLVEHKLFRPPQPVASIIEDSNAVWSKEYDSGIAKTLKQGQVLALEQGSAQISMACGADIVLQAPCTVKLVADDLVVLQRGVITAQAATWATGFVVETKGLRITDLGTRFAVSADATGISEAHVLEGSVLAEPMRDIRPKRSSMLLKKGEAIRVSLPQSTIDLIAAKNTDFIDHLPKFRPLRPIRIWNTGLGGVVGQEDTHWQIVAGDPANGPYPKPAVITPGDPTYLDNLPDASQWISLESDPGTTPDSVHTFETRFDLTGYDMDTVCMVGLFLVDDAINRLSINGTDIPFERWASKWDVQDFQRFRAIVIDHGFVAGENVISIDVYNSPNHPTRNEGTNPTGLRVEWQAFACEAAKTAS